MAALTYQTNAVDGTGLTTYTFTSQNIGTAAADRRVHVGIAGFSNTSGRTISSVTVGGVAATINIQISNGAQEVIAAIATALVPTGTTATVVVTFSAAEIACGIGIWSSTGLTSNTATDTKSSTAQPGSVSLTTISGFAIGMSCQNNASTYTWTNLTERFDTFASASSSANSGADANTSTGTLAVSCAYSVSDTRCALVGASFGTASTSRSFGVLIG